MLYFMKPSSMVPIGRSGQLECGPYQSEISLALWSGLARTLAFGAIFPTVVLSMLGCRIQLSTAQKSSTVEIDRISFCFSAWASCLVQLCARGCLRTPQILLFFKQPVSTTWLLLIAVFFTLWHRRFLSSLLDIFTIYLPSSLVLLQHHPWCQIFHHQNCQ